MISGSLVALVTPFSNDKIDTVALRRLVEWHIKQGTNGIVPVGTTGESTALSEQEHCHIVEVVVAEVDGRIPVVAGAGSNNTREAVFYNRFAEDTGADATLHVAGYYNRPSQEGLYQHFRAVHDSSNIPLIVYNIPPRAIVDISPDTMARIAALPRVAGVKDATGDLTRPIRERLLINGEFTFLSGEDGTAVAYNAAGGNGCISVTANVAPELCANMQQACAEGDYKSAAAIQERLMPLHMALFSEPSPAGAKYAMSLLGFCSDSCRLPIVPLSGGSKSAIRKAMTELNLL
jgi:4-hydroxy-tetrahydrodipicolinate synthase